MYDLSLLKLQLFSTRVLLTLSNKKINKNSTALGLITPTLRDFFCLNSTMHKKCTKFRTAAAVDDNYFLRRESHTCSCYIRVDISI